MKRILQGGFLTLSGVIGIVGIVIAAMQNPSTQWVKRCYWYCGNRNCSNAKSINPVDNTTWQNDNKHFRKWTISSCHFSSRSFRLWFVHSLKKRQAMLKVPVLSNTTWQNDNKHFRKWTISSCHFSSRSFRLWFVHSLKKRQAMLKVPVLRRDTLPP